MSPVYADTFTDWVAANDSAAVGSVVLAAVASLWFRGTSRRRWGHLVPLRFKLLVGAVAIAALLAFGAQAADLRVVDDTPGEAP